VDPAPPADRAPPRSAGAALLWSGLAVSGLALALYAGGIAGWRGGPLWVGLPLVLGAAALARHLLGIVDNRWAWALVVAVAGLILTGLLVEHAPYSTGRLAGDMDRLRLPFFAEVAEERAGHSWCRPSCPAVTRTYRSADTSAAAAMLTVGAALLERGVISDQAMLADITRSGTFSMRAAAYTVRVAITDRDRTLGRRRITITYASRRR
jgi:hypothetical protein